MSVCRFVLCIRGYQGCAYTVQPYASHMYLRLHTHPHTPTHMHTHLPHLPTPSPPHTHTQCTPILPLPPPYFSAPYTPPTTALPSTPTSPSSTLLPTEQPPPYSSVSGQNLFVQCRVCQHVIHVASGTQTRVVKCSNCREATVGGGKGRGVALYPSSFLVLCPAHARLPVRNGLVNEVKFLGLITQNG